jgi:hypothetical protein
MDINITSFNGTNFAILESNQVEIKDAQDALELLANASYQDAFKVIVKAENIHPDFFDLKTGIAGEILQKFSNYDKQLAIIGDFSKYTSKNLHNFMYESNKVGRVLFVNSLAEAQEKWLVK